MTTRIDQKSRAAAQLEIGKIIASKTNPRKHFDEKALSELTESVRKHGILQPILVRPVPGNGHFELIAGERRWRAAREAKLGQLPAVIMDGLSDRDVLEIQVIENLQRADLHPMEEAEGYEKLHRDHNMLVEDIAAKVGKSKAYVYGRMKLCSLSPKARKSFYADQINASIALLLARIPETKNQDQALGEILEGNYDGPMSYREAAEHVQRDYMLRLAQAPFDAADEKLYPEAGSCGKCPFRTGNQPELFADIKSADVCTKPTCFQEKTKRAMQQKLAAAQASGKEILTGQAARRATSYGSGYVRLSDSCNEDRKGRTYHKLLRGMPLPTVVADLGDGQMEELARKEDVAQAIKAVCPEAARDLTREARDSSRRVGDRKAELRKARIKSEVGRRIMAIIVEKAEAAAGADFWRLLAQAAIARAWHDTIVGIAMRRDPSVKRSMGSECVRKIEKGMTTEKELRALAVEVLLTPCFTYSYYIDPVKTPALKYFKIDQAKIESQVRSELK